MKKKGRHLVTEMVPVRNLRTYPGNARIHEMGKLVESLSEHGQYKPIVAQVSTGFVLAGNGTLEAARDWLGWEDILVTWVDVDDDQARRIVLVDNASSDGAGYDPLALAELLTGLDTYIGTGFTEGEVEALLGAIHQNTEELLTETLTEELLPPEDEDPGDDENFHTITPRKVLLPDPPAKWPSSDWWEMPALDPEMIPELPVDRRWGVWAGYEVNQFLEPSDMYLFITGRDSSRGLPWDRSVLAFWTGDDRFDKWWTNPAYHIARLVHVGCWAMVEPDWSVYYDHMPRVERYWNVYRNRWIGRYAQEAGVKVIPNITFALAGDDEAHLSGIPENPNSVAMQLQTLGDDHTRLMHRWLLHVERTLRPKVFLFYGFTKNRDQIPKTLSTPHIFVRNRSEAKQEGWARKWDVARARRDEVAPEPSDVTRWRGKGSTP